MRFALVLILLCGFFCHASEESSSVSVRQWQLGIGPAFMDGVNTPYVITSWRFGYLYQPKPSFDLQVIFDWAYSNKNTDMHYFRVAIAGDYFFTDADNAPFATLDAGYGSVHAHRPCEDVSCQSTDDDAGGYSAGIGVGYKFRRSSSVSYGILVHIGAIFERTRAGLPAKYAVMGAVYF